MSWQDATFAAGSVIFILALLPSFKPGRMPDWRTSALTGSVLIAYAFAQATLGLALASATTLALGVEWWVLAFLALARGGAR